MLDYIPVSEALPVQLTDVIGIVPDDCCPVRMLVFLRRDGRFMVSQCERDLEVQVLAWMPLHPIPSHYLQEAA